MAAVGQERSVLIGTESVCCCSESGLSIRPSNPSASCQQWSLLFTPFGPKLLHALYGQKFLPHGRKTDFFNSICHFRSS